MIAEKFKDLPNKSLLRIDEVALFFGVHQRTVTRWLNEGTLEHVKPGGKTIRIFRESVVKLIKKTKESGI